jgi:superfamily II DNA or RNA helicase
VDPNWGSREPNPAHEARGFAGVASKVARAFTDGVRDRGYAYFAKSRVVITQARPGDLVIAKVRGTETYRVRLRLRGSKLLASCTCPFFGPEGEPCKHLWATILAADARGLLPCVPVRPVKFVPDLRFYHSNAATPGMFETPSGPNELMPPEPTQHSERPSNPGPLGDAPAVFPGPGPGYGTPPSQYGQPAYRPYPYGSGSTIEPSSGYGPRDPVGGPNAYGSAPSRPPNRGYPKPADRRPPDRRRGAVPPPPPPRRGYNQPQNPPNSGYLGYGNPQGGGYGPAPYSPGGNAHRPPIDPQAPGARRRPGHLPPGRGPGQVSPRELKRIEAAKRAEAKRHALVYILDAPATIALNQIVIIPARRFRKPGTDRPVLRPWWPNQAPSRHGAWRPDPDDRIILDTLADCQIAPTPATTATTNGANYATPTSPGANGAASRRFVLRTEVQASIVERLSKTGRCRLRRTEDEEDPPVLRWDDGRPWRFMIDAKLADPAARRWTWRGSLRRGDDRMDLAEPLVLLPGLVLHGVGRAARFDDAGVFAWMLRLRHEKEMSLSETQQDSMLSKILGDARVPADELVEGLDLQTVTLPPVPCLSVRAPMQLRGSDTLIGELMFDYDGVKVPWFPPGKVAVQTNRQRAIRRSEKAEQQAKTRLDDLGFREMRVSWAERDSLEVSSKRVPQATRELVAEGWRVEADGVLYRPASDFKLAVTTNIDWFELDAQVDFGGQQVALPKILDAARRGETTITLGDGSVGMLPDDWLKKYGILADLGTTTEAGGLRFGRAQAALLDTLLANQPGSQADPEFTKVRQELTAFEGVEAIDAPAGFQGELRPYQREGLGWLEYLRRFEFGGILADDMGLGKTIQVLALLQRRRSRRQAKGPSLIVVPRSLVFNWIQEAAKFTPRLKVLDYTGQGRRALRDDFDKYDLVVTTYGTLRSDIVDLSQITFDYAILDEAQAIKNADSQSAKAARLLKARARLAMTGTPIENHLGELWSIFEFLNPGMLGSANVFKRHAAALTGGDEQGRRLLARALRPFILRRTKRQVVKDLPEKVEQTLYCDLETEQRQMYEGLKLHYRNALLRKDDGALQRSKIEVLEALLRLRQASCHPGLIDKTRTAEPSAKLEMLLPQLEEVIEEGHKALVFSQFTSFLSIVRKRLDDAGIVYEYLDGKTRDREARVERFQNDPDVPLFLISLKAGGLGLNLTAAEYVYLLDPWWNPAVEAQAIDRSHRIGQTQQVFAYRLIARDTVEQKILELQQKKRDLADAILGGDSRMISTLSRDDLEFLLS